MNSEKITTFFASLPKLQVPRGIEVMNPYKDKDAIGLVKQFYDRFYSDSQSRTLMLGINPGRFGAGITGISFTDPIRLEKVCGIKNALEKKPELSSDFIYRMIDAYGGVDKFYGRFLISAVSPLGFTKAGKNINYYDDPKLQSAVRPFAIACIDQLATLGVNQAKCFCIGEGKNHLFLTRLNEEMKWFKEIIPLPHPRFVMQYKRKKLSEYLGKYVEALG